MGNNTAAEKRREYCREYYRAKYAKEPHFRMKTAMYAKFHHLLPVLLAHRRNAKLDLLGATPEAFLRHIEKQFEPGMTWFNYGTVWNFDHKKPVSTFDLSDPAERKKCWDYRNFRPRRKELNTRFGLGRTVV